MVQQLLFFYEWVVLKKYFFGPLCFVPKISDAYFIIVFLYVDNTYVVTRNICNIKELKQELNKSFTMKDLGPARHILGMQIVRDRDAKKLWLS